MRKVAVVFTTFALRLSYRRYRFCDVFSLPTLLIRGRGVTSIARAPPLYDFVTELRGGIANLGDPPPSPESLPLFCYAFSFYSVGRIGVPNGRNWAWFGIQDPSRPTVRVGRYRCRSGSGNRVNNSACARGITQRARLFSPCV